MVIHAVAILATHRQDHVTALHHHVVHQVALSPVHRVVHQLTTTTTTAINSNLHAKACEILKAGGNPLPN